MAGRPKHELVMVVRPHDRLVGCCSCGWVTIVERYEQLQAEFAEHAAAMRARPRRRG